MNDRVAHPHTQPVGRASVSAPVRPLAFSLIIAATALALHAEPPQTKPVTTASVERIAVSRRVGVTSLALGNGVDIHLRPMPKPGTGRVMIAVVVPGLELDETVATRGSSMLVIDALVPADGPTRLRASQRPEGLVLTVACSTAEIEGALKQIALTLSDPTIDQANFSRARDQAVAQREGVEKGSDYQAAEAMLRLLTPGNDPRLHRPTKHQLEAVAFESARSQLKAQLLGRAVDVAIVGDVDVGAVVPAVTGALGTIPPRQRDRLLERRSIPRDPPSPASAPRVANALDSTAYGSRPLLTVSLPAPAITDLADARLAAVAARLLERQAADALRESGLNVTVASAVAMTGRTYINLGSVIASFVISGDDASLRSAAGVVRARIARLIENGPTEAQLQRAIDDAIAEIEPRLDSAEYWSQSLALAWFLGVPIDELDTAPATVRAATVQRVRQHMAKWWLPEQTRTVTILPEPKHPEQSAPKPAERPHNP